MGRFSAWAVRRPIVALISWFVLLVAVGVFGGVFGGQYKDTFELPDTESATAQRLLAQSVGDAASEGSAVRVVWSPASGSAVAPEVAATIQPVLQQISELGSVECVQSPFGAPIGSNCPAQPKPTPPANLTPAQQQAIAEAVKAAEAALAPVSPDGRVAYATVTLTGDGSPGSVSNADLQQLVSLVNSLKGQDGLTVGATGAVLSFAEVEPPSSEGIGLLAAIIILLIAFGSVVAAGLPIIVAIFGLTGGLMLSLVTARFLDVATFGPTLAAMIGLGVGIDYALFVVNRFRQAKLAGHDARAAALEAVNTAGRAVAFAGITVIIALLGLLVLGISFFNGLALAAAGTVLMVMLSALWMLPALLGLLKDKALALRMPWNRKAKQWHPEGGAWARYGRGLQKRPLVPFALALVAVLVIAAPVLSMRLGFSDDGGRAEGSLSRTGYDLMADGFGPGVNGPFFVAVQLPKAGDTAAVAATVAALEQTPGVARTLPNSAMIPIAVTPSTMIAAIQVIPDSAPQDEATTELLERLRDTTLPQVDAQTGADSYVGGAQAITSDFTTVLIQALPIFLAVVVGLGFVALVVLFHSLLVPLIAALTSLLSLAAAMGITVAVFQWGWLSGVLGVTGTGPIMPFLPVMVFAILFGLSMDYQVFLATRMQEEWQHSHDNRRSVRRGLAGSGRVVAIAALIMSSVFIAFIPSTTQEIKLFGVALASAVLIDAFVVRLVLVPSLMSMTGSANWWLPRWLDRVLPTVNVEGGSDEIADDPGDPEDSPAAPVDPAGR